MTAPVDGIPRIDLQGKVAVVTGAGQGLGRAYAVALGQAGASVVVNDLDQRQADETARLVGQRATVVAGDVAERATAEALVARAVETFGRLDAMVTNAGVLRDAVLWKMTDDDFDLVVRTHLRGTFMCARAAAIRMREQGTGGRIVVVGSPAGQFGNFGQTNYAAAKAGVVAFARTWSLELARASITVNAIVPTAWTAMTATIPLYRPLVAKVAAGEPFPPAVRREHAIGRAEDCAGLVVFLASDAAGDITGQAIGIGGDRLCLYSHPAELVVELRENGWDADAIAAIWQSRFAGRRQPSGVQLPKIEL